MAGSSRSRGKGWLWAVALLSGAFLALGVPSGAAVGATIAPEAVSALQTLAVREKLAHDAYAVFTAQTTLPIFGNLTDGESQHLTTVRALLSKHGIVDLTAGDEVGDFDDATVKATYDAAVVAGSVSTAAALQQGIGMERALSTQLAGMLASDVPKDVRKVATNLLDATGNHLAALEQILAATPPASDPPTADPPGIARVQTAQVRAQVSGRYRVGERLTLSPSPVKTDAGVTLRWRVTKETRATCTVRTHNGASTVLLRAPGRCVVVGYAPAPSPEYAPFTVTRTYRVMGRATSG
jgi:hypothetical protein